MPRRPCQGKALKPRDFLVAGSFSLGSTHIGGHDLPSLRSLKTAVPITRRRVFGLLAGAGALVGVSSLWMSRMKTYDGPVSDHFDGLHFFDPDGAPPRSLGEVLRWQLGGRGQRADWPDWAPSPYADTPPERVDGEKVRLSFVGHASWLIQAGGLNILVDPVWSMRVSPVAWAGPKRHNDPGIAFDHLPKIDVVLVSHGHYDHLDIATLSRLTKNFAPRVVTPLGNDVTMRSTDPTIKVEAFDWHDPVELGGGIAVRPVPTRHWTARGMFDRNKALWASFVLETPAGKSTSSAIPAMATAGIFVASPRSTGRSAWRSSPSAPTSRAGSCATST